MEEMKMEKEMEMEMESRVSLLEKRHPKKTPTSFLGAGFLGCRFFLFFLFYLFIYFFSKT